MLPDGSVDLYSRDAQDIRSVLEQAAICVDDIEAMPSFKVTRAGFAIEALRGLTEAGEKLLFEGQSPWLKLRSSSRKTAC